MKTTCALTLLIWMLLTAGCTTFQSPRTYLEIKPNQEFPKDWLTSRTSIEEIQKEIDLKLPNIDESWLEEWAAFKGKYEERMEIWNFADDWTWDAQLVGYVIIENERMIDSIGGIRLKEEKAEQGSRYNSGQAPRVVDAARANHPNHFLNGRLGPRVSL